MSVDALGPQSDLMMHHHHHHLSHHHQVHGLTHHMLPHHMDQAEMVMDGCRAIKPADRLTQRRNRIAGPAAAQQGDAEDM